jgi:hypothetical protein
MTLRAAITADVARVILRQDDFAQEVTRYPLGLLADAETGIVAIVDRDEEADAESLQAGGPQHDERGSQIRRHCVLEIPTAIVVDERDTWLVAGELWRTRRIGGRDDDLQSVHCFRLVAARTNKSRLASSRERN